MNEIWNSNLIHLLTSVCNIPQSSILRHFRVDHGLHGDKNLVGFSVIFQKSPIPRQKHKSPSSIRRSQLRKEIRRQQRSQQHGLGTQATSSSVSTSQSGVSWSLNPEQPTTANLTFNTSSEHKTTTNANASFNQIDRLPHSASSFVTSQITGRSASTSSSSPSSFKTPGQRRIVTTSGPLLVLRATLDDGTVVRKRLSPATSSSSFSSSARAIATANKSSQATTTTTQSAFDLPASLHQEDASTRSDSFHDQLTPQAPLQSPLTSPQTTTQFQFTQQDGNAAASFSIGVDASARSHSQSKSRRYRPKTFLPPNPRPINADIEDL